MSGVTRPPNKDGFRARYYRCHHRARNGAQACPNAKGHRADRIEKDVWEEISGLLKSPERLRVGIEHMIADLRTAVRTDPAEKISYWHGKLERIERMRSGYLDQQAEGIISMTELKSKLATLNEQRTVIEGELEALTLQEERIAALERDAEALIERYRVGAREGLDLYTPPGRHDAYTSLGIRVIAYPDGTTEVTGSVLMDIDSDTIRSNPSERSHAPLSTGTSCPLFTVTPPVESR